MGTARDAATATRHLSSRSLAQEVRERVRGITIHDLEMEYCVKQTEKNNLV
jgi:hypothetical protein